MFYLQIKLIALDTIHIKPDQMVMILSESCGDSSSNTSENLQQILHEGVATEEHQPTSAASTKSKIEAHGTASEAISLNEAASSGNSSGSRNRNVSVVTPFLAKHLNDQNQIPRDNYYRYCYRHNPEVTCNKEADNTKMNYIQKSLEKLPSRDQEAINHVWSIFNAAPDNYRRLILRGLLSQCCFPQLSFVSQEVSSLIRIDFLSALPSEISLKILCYLDCASLCNAAQVSRKWQSLADDDRVWHHMCEQHIDRKCPNCGWGLPLMHMKRAREMTDDETKQSTYSETSPDTSSPSSGEKRDRENDEVESELKRIKMSQNENALQRKVLKKRPWKSVYSERYKLEKNWRKGLYTVKTFEGHTDGITCLQFNQKYLMTGSYDATVKIWRVDTGECIRTLTGHKKGIRSLAFDGQKLITSGLDSTIKVWNYHTGNCISTYRGHTDAVVSVDFLNKTIVSGSADQTVKVWHVDSRTCYTLRGHTDWVNSVKIHALSNTVFSASDDTTVRMWDLENNNCLRVFGGVDNNGHIGQVQCVIPFIYNNELVEDFVESEPSTGQGVINASDNSSSRNSDQLELTPSDSEINNAPLPENRNYPTHLLTCSLDNTIKLWNVKTGKCIRTQFGHIDVVWSLSSDTFRIISGAHDRLVKVWDLQNGKCLHTFSNNSSVSCVGLSDSRFAAGLENGSVKMWSFE